MSLRGATLRMDAETQRLLRLNITHIQNLLYTGNTVSAQTLLADVRTALAYATLPVSAEPGCTPAEARLVDALKQLVADWRR